MLLTMLLRIFNFLDVRIALIFKIVALICATIFVSSFPFLTNTEFLLNLTTYLNTDTENNFNKMIHYINKTISNKSTGNFDVFTEPCNLSGLACTSNCSRPLSESYKERLLDVLSSANLSLSSQELKDILSVADTIPSDDVIILSAASSNHFDEMQGMFYNLHNHVLPVLQNVTIVLFDIGLSETERNKTEKHCRCKVVRFPVEKFPPHVANNYCYSWKPIIIRSTIEKARKLLIYQDSSIRWTSRITDTMARAANVGLVFFRDSRSWRIPVQTVKETFDHFGEEPCAFDPFPELTAAVSLYGRNVFNTRALLEPLAKCALTSHCICPPGSESNFNCYPPKVYHGCHRFDQSALGMITAKLFNQDFGRVISPYFNNEVSLQRGDDMPSYFD